MLFFRAERDSIIESSSESILMENPHSEEIPRGVGIIFIEKDSDFNLASSSMASWVFLKVRIKLFNDFDPRFIGGFTDYLCLNSGSP